MSGAVKHSPFIEETTEISSNKNAKNDKNKKIELVKKDKDGILIELSKNKMEEDEKSTNSAEFSGQELRKEKEKENNSILLINPKKLSKKAYEKMTQKMKENTMRMEIEKIDKETERIRQKYEEKNAFLHSFDNNPQFQKMLKNVEKQLKVIFLFGIIVCVFSSLVYFYVTKRKDGCSLASFSLSVAEIAIVLILIITLKIGLLNDPNLSKAFRLFVIFELLIIIGTFIINVIVIVVIQEYLSNQQSITKIIVYLLFVLLIGLFVIGFKMCLPLFIESILILLNKKTEYSILIINEQNAKSESNVINNLSTSNNYSTEGLNNDTTTGIISENEKKQGLEITNKEEEKYKNMNYFNKFHYSVTSDRKDVNNYFKKKYKCLYFLNLSILLADNFIMSLSKNGAGILG